MSNQRSHTPHDAVPISEAIEMYLDHREGELSSATHDSHRYRLSHLVRWADQHDEVTDTGDLTGRTLMQYRQWRADDGDLSTVSLHTQLSTVRVWLRFLESIDAVHDGLAEKLDVPSLDGTVRDETVLPAEHADQIDEYLTQFYYGSVDHVLWSLLYGIGIRLGAAHSLDVKDFQPDEKRLWFRHRPETDTTLKNGTNGERPVTLSEPLVDVLTAYCDNVRTPTRDEHGRKPLLVVGEGRPSKSTLRRRIYRWTQPCQLGVECPHGTTESACPTAGYTDEPSGCPSIINPHAIRKRVIIDYRKEEIPDKYISDRCNVNQRTMSQNYDTRSEAEQQKDRSHYFE